MSDRSVGAELPPFVGGLSQGTPQRPLRIGRGGKYYEILYVGGVAQERRLQRKEGNEISNATMNSAEPNSNGSGKERQVLELQDQGELQPQVSVRRRRSQVLNIMPTPPLRRSRRSKENTPNLESTDGSTSEDISHKPSNLGVVHEQDIDVFYNTLPPPRPVHATEIIANKLIENGVSTEMAVQNNEDILSAVVPSQSGQHQQQFSKPVEEDTQSRTKNDTALIDDQLYLAMCQLSGNIPQGGNKNFENQIEKQVYSTVQTEKQGISMKDTVISTKFQQSTKVDKTVKTLTLSETQTSKQKSRSPRNISPVSDSLLLKTIQERQDRIRENENQVEVAQGHPIYATVDKVVVNKPPPLIIPQQMHDSQNYWTTHARDSAEVSDYHQVSTPITKEPAIQITPTVQKAPFAIPSEFQSPNNVTEYYYEEEYIYEDQPDGSGPLKRKSSKILRKLQGLFDKKKPDESGLGADLEQKPQDRLDATPSPKEPVTPSKKSKIGQFFTFSKKNEKKKASTSPTVAGAALQGPADIPDGMLRDVFINKLEKDREQAKREMPQTAPPILNFREWTSSAEELAESTTKKSEPPLSSKYFVQKIPPFQKPATPSAKQLNVAQNEEAQNSPYTLCANRGNVKSESSSRRSSLASDEVETMYEDYFTQKQKECGSDCTEKMKDSNKGLQRKPSKKASGIPPELRAPLYKPNVTESMQPTISIPSVKVDAAPTPKEPEVPSESQYAPEGESNATEQGRSATQEDTRTEIRRRAVHDLRSFSGQAWLIVKIMLQDLIDGVPDEMWIELQILLLILCGMLALLYLRGVVHLNGEHFFNVFRSLCQGLKIFLSAVIHGCLNLYVAIDELVNDASTKLVADTLNEI